jgi:inorganic pyrophosphatase
MASHKNPFIHLPAFDPETDHLNVIIETPKGSRNKYKYDPKNGLFKLSKVLPAGSTFPYDFGYIPSTEGQDGDPLDVLILMDEATFPGCFIQARLIGAIQAEQHEKQHAKRNDRLIAVAVCSHDQHNIDALDHLNEHLVTEIEHFFVSYHELEGEEFVPEAHLSSAKARKIVDAQITPNKPAKRKTKIKK